MIIFLDFDGVLHPFPMAPTSIHFSSLAPFWKVLTKMPEVSVVITSTWRERASLPQLVKLLTANGGEEFTNRFIGITPILESVSDYVPGIRQREIESWLIDNCLTEEHYIILDDIEEYFDSSCTHLYLVDGTTGLTEHDAEMIPRWLGNFK